MTAPAVARTRMPLNEAARLALSDELTITAAAWPSLKANDAAMVAYAEAIPFASADEIRQAFALARRSATDWPPRPNDVRNAIHARLRAERASGAARGLPDGPALSPEETRLHGAIARLSWQQFFPIATRRGVTSPQTGCPDASKPGYAELWRRYEGGHVQSVVVAVAILDMHNADPQHLLAVAKSPLHINLPPAPEAQPNGVQ